MRCKACDVLLKPTEIIWREDIGEHEDLCLKCRSIATGFTEQDLADMDTVESIHSGVFKDDPEQQAGD